MRLKTRMCPFGEQASSVLVGLHTTPCAAPAARSSRAGEKTWDVPWLSAEEFPQGHIVGHLQSDTDRGRWTEPDPSSPPCHQQRDNL